MSDVGQCAGMHPHCARLPIFFAYMNNSKGQFGCEEKSVKKIFLSGQTISLLLISREILQ